MSFLGDIVDAVDDMTNQLGEELDKPRKKYGIESGDGGGSAGTIRFPSIEEANAVIGVMRETSREMKELEETVLRLRRALEIHFCADPDSVRWSETAMRSADRLEEFNKSGYEYTDGFIELYETATANTHQTESDIEEGMNRGVVGE